MKAAFKPFCVLLGCYLAIAAIVPFYNVKKRTAPAVLWRGVSPPIRLDPGFATVPNQNKSNVTTVSKPIFLQKYNYITEEIHSAAA